jgi:hypothetical protein
MAIGTADAPKRSIVINLFDEILQMYMVNSKLKCGFEDFYGDTLLFCFCMETPVRASLSSNHNFLL